MSLRLLSNCLLSIFNRKERKILRKERKEKEL